MCECANHYFACTQNATWVDTQALYTHDSMKNTRLTISFSLLYEYSMVMISYIVLEDCE